MLMLDFFNGVESRKLNISIENNDRVIRLKRINKNPSTNVCPACNKKEDWDCALQCYNADSRHEEQINKKLCKTNSYRRSNEDKKSVVPIMIDDIKMHFQVSQHLAQINY